MTAVDTAGAASAGAVRRTLREFREVIEALPTASPLTEAWRHGRFAAESDAHDRVAAAISDANTDDTTVVIDDMDLERLRIFVQIAEDEGVAPRTNPT